MRRKAYIALFFQNTVCLIRVQDKLNNSTIWKFPGGEINSNETLLEGAFRNFALKTGNIPSKQQLRGASYAKLQPQLNHDDDKFNFNLEEWARQTNHSFEIALTKRTSTFFNSVEITYFYCICKTKPPIVFTRTTNNQNVFFMEWCNIDELSRYGLLEENIASVVNVVKDAKHQIFLKSRPRESAPDLSEFDDDPIPQIQIQASAPPMDDDYFQGGRKKNKRSFKKYKRSNGYKKKNKNMSKKKIKKKSKKYIK